MCVFAFLGEKKFIKIKLDRTDYYSKVSRDVKTSEKYIWMKWEERLEGEHN